MFLLLSDILSGLLTLVLGSLFITLLRVDLHTVQFTHLKCTILWFRLQICATIIIIIPTPRITFLPFSYQSPVFSKSKVTINLPALFVEETIHFPLNCHGTSVNQLTIYRFIYRFSIFFHCCMGLVFSCPVLLISY